MFKYVPGKCSTLAWPHLAYGCLPSQSALVVAAEGCGSSGQPSPYHCSPPSWCGGVQRLYAQTEQRGCWELPSQHGSTLCTTARVLQTHMALKASTSQAKNSFGKSSKLEVIGLPEDFLE